MQKMQSIGEAVAFLYAHLNQIHTVSEWARAAGYSRAYFSVLINQRFGESPYEIIKRKKYQKIKQLVRRNSEMKGKVIARRVGFDSVESLYKFLRRDYDTNLTALRQDSNRS